MSFGTDSTKTRSAAWGISLWGTLAFACGSMVVFAFLNAFVAHDIQRRTDAWLSGEVETMSDVAERTPKDRLYGRVVGEIAELATREVPDRQRTPGAPNTAVFFLQTSANGEPGLWVGEGNGAPEMAAIRGNAQEVDTPFDLQVQGVKTPFRVAMVPMDDGGRLYLGVSERDQLHVLRKLQIRFLLLWLLNVLLGFGIVFYITRRMLYAVRNITQAASRIGESDLSERVPSSGRNDEVGQLASTLNRMLDRIERSIHQLHTITDSLAHDLRSPLTAIRAKLEMSLGAGQRPQDADAIVAAIDEVDRLTEILNKSLDVAEAEVDALRLERTRVDLDELVRVMVELYEPCMSETGLRIQLRSSGPLVVRADAALLHRVVANLFDNEMKHLPASCTVTISLTEQDGCAVLMLEDDGPGFASEIRSSLFEARVKGRDSAGHGLGLAFVQAVAGAHNGEVTAVNREEGGARLTIRLPMASAGEPRADAVLSAGD
ncbi:MAG: HAMP domain-containing sensor histidine kinase [Acidobacteriota bacterium]